MSKSKGKARQTQHRKAIRPQDSSDSNEDELPRTRDQTLSKGKRSIGAPGSSTATGAKFPKFVKKRPRLSSPGGEKDTVSQRRCQLQCYQLIVQSSVGRKHFQTSQPAVMTEVSHRPCFLSVGCHSLYRSQPHRPAEKSVTPTTLHHLYFPHLPLQPLSFLSSLHESLPFSRCLLLWGSILPNLQRSSRRSGPCPRVPFVSLTGSSNQRLSVSMLQISNQVALFQLKPV